MTTQSLNLLRTNRARREHDVSLAMLVILEMLSPAERAAFVLRKVFGMSREEIAAALDRTPARLPASLSA